MPILKFIRIPSATKKALIAMMGMIENGLISKEFISIQSVYPFNPAMFLTLAELNRRRFLKIFHKFNQFTLSWI
jgi:hypothetical protein